MERELAECLPAEPDELRQLEKEYGGTHASINGKLMHIMVWSRLELGYGVTQSARFTPVPNKVTLQISNAWDASFSTIHIDPSCTQ